MSIYTQRWKGLLGCEGVLMLVLSEKGGPRLSKVPHLQVLVFNKRELFYHSFWGSNDPLALFL